MRHCAWPAVRQAVRAARTASLRAKLREPRGKDEGKAPPLMWLPALMSSQAETVRPSADEAAWRSLFSRPSREYCCARRSLARSERRPPVRVPRPVTSTSAHALHFRAGAGTLLVASRRGRRSARHSRCRMRALGGFRAIGQALGVQGLHTRWNRHGGRWWRAASGGGKSKGAGRAGGDRAEMLTLSGFSWANEVRHARDAYRAQSGLCARRARREYQGPLQIWHRGRLAICAPRVSMRTHACRGS